MGKPYKKCLDCGAHLDTNEKCDCQDYGATKESRTAQRLRDIAGILSITADSDANIQKALTGILNIANDLERGG